MNLLNLLFSFWTSQLIDYLRFTSVLFPKAKPIKSTELDYSMIQFVNDPVFVNLG